MEKNRLLLNQKKYVSFSNYKNLISASNNNQNELKIFLSTNYRSLHLNFQNKNPKNKINNNLNNVPSLLNHTNSNKLFNNKSVKLFSLNKLMAQLNKSKKNVILRNDNKVLRLKLKQNINDKIRYSNDNLNKSYKRYINNKIEGIKKYRYSLNCSARIKNENIIDMENNKENNEKFNENLKSSKAFISSRKLNKELFGSAIYKIIKEHKGRKKCKFKIIGKLKTEPNYN
jgi:hypothetical protein